MARIKIEDLPVKEEMSEKELKGVFGGMGLLLPAVQKVRAAGWKVRAAHTPTNFDVQDLMSRYRQR